jgi:hypothetical protein
MTELSVTAAVPLLRASDRAAAVLRRSERACFSPANDDEVGGLQSAIRSERSEQLNTVSRAEVLSQAGAGAPASATERAMETARAALSSASDDEEGGLQRDARAEGQNKSGLE